MPRPSKLLVAVASSLAALGIAWALRGRRDAPEDTALVDDREEFREFLEQRSDAAEPDSEAPLFGPIHEEDALKVFAGLKSEAVYDPDVYYVRAPNLLAPRSFPEHPGGKWVMRTNSKGFREDAELPDAADARVVVLGDSHTDGVCNNRYSFANVLEALLAERHPGKAIDVANAGVGSHSFYNYLGAVNKYGRELAPDVIVCAVYGGNDFLGVLRPLHYFLRKPMPIGGEDYFERERNFRLATKERADRNLGQAVMQLHYLSSFPDQADLAVDTAVLLTREMAARANAQGIELVMVYLPPLWDVQRERYEPSREGVERALKLGPDPAAWTADRWADRWLAATADLDAAFVDLRPSFRAAELGLYWERDHHVNVDGHRRVALELLPVVEPLLGLP